MQETEYVKSKFMLSSKLVELESTLDFMEKQIDSIYKINFYLMEKYRDDLIKEFGIATEDDIPNELFSFIRSMNIKDVDEKATLNVINNDRIMKKIMEIMNERMPDPWYCYGFGGSGNAT